MARLDGRVSSMQSSVSNRKAGRFPHGAPVLTTDAFPPPALDDAVADLALRFATEHGVSVPKRAGHGDRLVEVWAALSSAGITNPGLAFAGGGVRTWLRGVF